MEIKPGETSRWLLPSIMAIINITPPPSPRLQTTFTEASLYSTLRMFPHYQLWKLLNLRLLRSAPKIRKVNNHILETPSVIGDYREGINDSLESQVQVMQMKRGERVIEMFMALFSWTKYPFFSRKFSKLL